MRNRLLLPAIAATLLAVGSAEAAEPNETFFDATLLAPGVLSVSDDLTRAPGPIPDLILGAKDASGTVAVWDDDLSPYGDGRASALYGVPTNDGSIDFVVSGLNDDFFFNGSHTESGRYSGYVSVFDASEELIGQFSVHDELVSGMADGYSLSDDSWIGGFYDIELNNLATDIDFFTFTGLTPGAMFSVETQAPHPGYVDTMLGWFSDTGELLDLNDDASFATLLSYLEGVVPASGQLTLAVTGNPDFDFVGDHDQTADYELVLTVEGDPLPGDFNHDNRVDAADYAVWRNGLNDAYGPEDYELWRTHYGEEIELATSRTAPEPTTSALAALACLLLSAREARGAEFV